MENEFQIFENEEFGKLRIVVIDGVIWFVGKDVAISLGYSNASKAVIVHVDEADKMILNQKDFEKMASESKIPILGTLEFDSPRGLTFINISGLFSLILSSKLPKAKDYRHWVTSKVLPSIHTKGYYIAPNVEKAVTVQNPLPKYHEILEDIAQSAAALNKYWGVNYGIGSATMTSVFEENHNINLTRIKNLLPPAEHEIGYMNATQLAKKVGLKSAQAVNKILLEKGFQEKDGNGGYKLTEKGKKYGEAMPYEKNGHTGYQIKWSTEILSFLQ